MNIYIREKLIILLLDTLNGVNGCLDIISAVMSN